MLLHTLLDFYLIQLGLTRKHPLQHMRISLISLHVSAYSSSSVFLPERGKWVSDSFSIVNIYICMVPSDLFTHIARHHRYIRITIGCNGAKHQQLLLWREHANRGHATTYTSPLQNDKDWNPVRRSYTTYIITVYSGTSPYGHLTSKNTSQLQSPWLSPKLYSTVQITPCNKVTYQLRSVLPSPVGFHCILQ